MSSNRLFRNLLALCVGLMLGAIAAYSHAAAVPLTPGPGIAGTASGFTTASSFTGQFSAAAFNSNFTTNVGGKAVTMPASMRMAANAGQFAVSAIRLNPAALVGGAVAAWLLSQGYEYLNGQFSKSEQIPGYVPGYKWCAEPGMSYEYCDATPQITCQSYFSKQPPDWRGAFNSCVMTVQQATSVNFNVNFQKYVISGYAVHRRTDSCSAGTRYVTGKGCIGLAVPMTDQNWADLASGTLPDQVAGELAAKGVPLPLEVPHIAPQDIPLSDPYFDPVTGKRYRDQARLTPSTDAKTADVQVTKQEVDDAGNPKKAEDGQTDKPPEEQTDFCKKNPDASSCKPFDDVPDSELQKKENPFSLNPVSGFGADNASCPAPQQLFTKGGQAITWDWGQFCTFAQGIRPLIIGFAWLAAISMVIVVGRRG